MTGRCKSSHKNSEKTNLKLCLQQKTQKYVQVSYSSGLNFALLFFLPVIFFFLSLEGLYTEEEALMLLIHILQLSIDLGIEAIYSLKNPLPWAGIMQVCGARALWGCCADWWHMLSTVPGSCLTSEPRACSEPHPHLSTYKGWNLHI